MVDQIKVCVTYDQNNRIIKKVEIIDQNESEDVAENALKVIPQVDAVSGASKISRVIMNAVNDAVKHANA
ncbi:fumarate reductase [Lactobacillus acetotolerans]|uniref:Fumarate reductase n=1 Tax=Lactobacillus acetotolerans TaxID=1600 RepID=A0A0D6A2Y7_9LACO|nr:FMN-binding protein [Lactobacillus acetotolerans]BAQ57173.1 fumarate reductase [Lactobacillus acetotolerans]